MYDYAAFAYWQDARESLIVLGLDVKDCMERIPQALSHMRTKELKEIDSIYICKWDGRRWKMLDGRENYVSVKKTISAASSARRRRSAMNRRTADGHA